MAARRRLRHSSEKTRTPSLASRTPEKRWRLLAQVGEKIGALGPLENEAGAAGGKRVPQKKIVDPIIEVAGLEGIAFEAIIAKASQSHGVELKPASLKSFLSRMKAEGVYEQRTDGRWRLTQPTRAAAE